MNHDNESQTLLLELKKAQHKILILESRLNQIENNRRPLEIYLEKKSSLQLSKTLNLFFFTIAKYLAKKFVSFVYKK